MATGAFDEQTSPLYDYVASQLVGGRLSAGIFPDVSTVTDNLLNTSTSTLDYTQAYLEPGDTVKVKYVAVERLNTEKAKQHWNSLANVVSVMSGKSLQTYLTSLGMDEEIEEEFLSIGEKIKETGNEFIYEIFVGFYNLVHSVYELKPTADVHVGNYGYDKYGNLKFLDI